MNLHAFYNNDNIGDILLVRLTDKRNVTETKMIKDVCILYSDKEVIGYNVMNASTYFNQLNKGKVKINEQFVSVLNNILKDIEQEEVYSDYNDHIVVGKVIEIEEHPDSDHMHICKVDVKDEVLQIVCGAPNVALNQLVVCARINAVMPSGLIIKPSKLRGTTSDGMLCSARELNLPDAPQVRGILILDENEYTIGESFFR